MGFLRTFNAYYALDDGLICNGNTPEEIEYVMKNSGVGFCLDIGHAVCASKFYKQEYLAFLQRFLILKPALFHLTDGDIDNVKDEHRHIGQGNYDMQKIIQFIPGGAMITLETNKDSKENLDDFVIDVEKLRIYDKN